MSLSLSPLTAHALGIHPRPGGPPAQPARPAAVARGRPGALGIERERWALTPPCPSILSLTLLISLHLRTQQSTPLSDDPLFGRAARANARRTWNAAVDAVFQPVVLALSRRGW